METRFTRLVGCTLPVQQAPMGPVSSPALAVAIANAGGVGSVTALGSTVQQLEATVAELNSATRGALSVNFLTSTVDADAVRAVADRVRIVDYFWADPDPALVALAHAGGALVSWQVGSLEEARAAADAGCDVIVVQGSEAGGHVRGHAALLPLLASVLDAVDHRPVLAAGGIGDGRALAAVLAAGADGARVGTRFIATTESGAHPQYKEAVVQATAGATEISGAFAQCPLCATSPRTRVLRSCVHALAELAGDTVGELVVGERRIPLPKGSGLPPFPGVDGHIDAMAMYASDAVAAVDTIEPAASVLTRMCEDAAQRLATATFQ